MVIRASAIFLLWLVCGCSCQGPPPSPCPDVFSYQRDSSGRWFGIVTILPPATFAEARLIFRMTVANYRLDKGYGNIQVLGGDAEVQEISKSAYQGVRRKIQFVINFPPISTIPRVKEVTINEVKFCGDIRNYDNVANIELNYVLKTGLDVGPVSGDAFSTVPARLHGNIPSPVSNQNTWNQQNPPPRVQSEIPSQNTWIQNDTSTQVQQQIPIQSTWNQPPPPAPVPPRSTQRPNRRKTTTTTTPDYEHEEEGEEDEEEEPCGLNSADHNYLLIHGSETSQDEWPWHIALFKNEKTGLKFICGGTIVDKSHIVTAAHCVYDDKKKSALPTRMFTVFLGKHDLANWSEKRAQNVAIEKIIIHPSFGSSKKKNNYDAAILKLSTPAKYSDYVRPVCLWDKPNDLRLIVNKNGTVVGWGVDEFGNSATKRRVLEMPVVSQEVCSASDPFFAERASNVTYCAGSRDGSGACNGDSGGGMVFKLENENQAGRRTWYLRGVVSLSKRVEDAKISCDTNNYMIFTDMAKLMPWVQKVLLEA